MNTTMTNNPIAAKLAEALRDCSDELAAEIADRYPKELRNQYERYARGYEHDMVSVEIAREALREYDDAKGREDQPVAQAVPVIMRSDIDAIRKAIQGEMLRVPDMAGGRRVETCLQLDSSRREYGWLYARHADGQWVTIAKLDGFSISMIQHEANAWWQRAIDRATATATATANGTAQAAGPQPPHAAPEAQDNGNV